MKRPIRKIFIANRGEICRRVAMAARQLGLETAAMVDPARPSLYLNQVLSEAVIVANLGTSDYLDRDKLIARAKDSGCDAIHPGYGYLSENCEFAEQVEAAGLCWIGPNVGSMASMASKAVARDIAEKADVPCLEALKFADAAELTARKSELELFAEKIGYPVLIKAALGGGGKGMRIVRSHDELLGAAERASSEATNAFGNPEIIVEKYVESPRHVEVQLLCDRHGQYFAIGDRDCSVQRRHQKIIEEAPAPELSPATRKKLHEAAVSLASEVNYDSVGTVEFLLDWGSKAQEEQKFFFLEMNTRLQVEHPVTEECYGIDLVAWQIRVAAGEKLPAHFAHLQPEGHVVELRIYAEDCEQDFLPAPGPVDLFLPDQSLPVRWDVGLDTIDEISSEFDPMIAKLIVSAPTRRDAFFRAAMSLEASAIAGTKNNQSFLIGICRDESFLAGAVTTHYLQENQDRLQSARAKVRESGAKKVEAVMSWLRREAFAHNGLTKAGVEERTREIFGSRHSGAESGIIVTSRDTELVGRECVTHGCLSASGLAAARFYRREYPSFTRYGVIAAGELYTVDQEKFGLDRFSRSQESEHSALSPVPGKVVAIHFQEGESVSKNEVVMILESMKMEFEVRADGERIIDKLLVQSGDQVDAGAALVRWQD